MSDAKLNLPLLTIESAEGKAKEMLEGAKKNMGMVPNMYAEMANAPGLLAAYLSGYKSFREESGLTPAEQEVVFLAVSRANGCHYCVAAHSMVAEKMSNVPAASLAALRAGKTLPDARLEAIRRFTHHMWETRGNPSKAELDAFRNAGYSDKDVLYVVLAMAVKTISNYTNHLFGTEVDAAFASYKIAS